MGGPVAVAEAPEEQTPEVVPAAEGPAGPAALEAAGGAAEDRARVASHLLRLDHSEAHHVVSWASAVATLSRRLYEVILQGWARAPADVTRTQTERVCNSTTL